MAVLPSRIPWKSVLLYGGLCRVFYGVWVPNPIVFK